VSRVVKRRQGISISIALSHLATCVSLYSLYSLSASLSPRRGLEPPGWLYSGGRVTSLSHAGQQRGHDEAQAPAESPLVLLHCDDEKRGGLLGPDQAHLVQIRKFMI